MKGLRLFLRTRRWRTNAVVIAAAAALVLACGPLVVGLNPGEEALVRVAMMVPVVPATLIAASLQSPLPIQESGATRALARLRVAHAVILSSGLVAALAASGASLPSPEAAAGGQGTLSLCRNALALTGAALICYRACGSKAGWLAPIVWIILPPQVIPRPENDQLGLFTLVSQPDSSANAFVFACIMWCVGVTCAATERRWPRVSGGAAHREP